MSLLREQIESIKYIGKFLDDIRFGPTKRSVKEIKERIKSLMHHYPCDIELEIWHKWLVEKKGHE